jgi:hypothetical protein
METNLSIGRGRGYFLQMCLEKCTAAPVGVADVPPGDGQSVPGGSRVRTVSLQEPGSAEALCDASPRIPCGSLPTTTLSTPGCKVGGTLSAPTSPYSPPNTSSNNVPRGRGRALFNRFRAPPLPVPGKMDDETHVKPVIPIPSDVV